MTASTLPGDSAADASARAAPSEKPAKITTGLSRLACATAASR